MIEIILAVIIILSVMLYKTTTKNFDYWKKRKVIHPPPVPVFGNFANFALSRTNLGGVSDEIYKRFPNEPYVGAFMGKTPLLVLRDPELIKLVMAKDFYYFHGRGFALDDVKQEPLNKNIFMSDGDEWRVLRQNLTPLFSSAKMRNMFYLMAQCGSEFENYVQKSLEEKDEFEMKDLTSRFTIDVIGSCAFGLQMHSMGEEDTEFRKVGFQLFRPTRARTIKALMRQIAPWLFKLLNLNIFDPSINEFFADLSKKVIEMREGEPIRRHDFVDLLAELKRKGHIDGDSIENMKPGAERKTIQLELDDKILAAQSFIFFGAGFETSSTTTSYALHELALNPEIQKRLQKEIDTLLAKHDSKITYELIQEAQYLDKVIDETGRKFPVLKATTRECTSKYTFPDGLVVEKGVKIHIPIYGLHTDPKYYPNPEVFDPERFNSESSHDRPQYTYLPFGEGQRLCIGMRFGKMSVAVGLISLLRRFSVEPCSRTETTIEMEPKSIITMAKNGIWLKLTSRTNPM